MPIVRAAGGLLWREGPSGPRVALVHRPRRDDWSLPKGKLDDGESWEEAAVREVREETGCEPSIVGFAGASSYLAKRAPKIVLYWHMALVREKRFEPNDEIDEVAWLTPEAAMRRLDYEPDRRLLSRGPPRAERGARIGPTAPAVAAARAELMRRVLAVGDGEDAPGVGPALELLDDADEALARGDPAGAWQLLAAARRLALLSADDEERGLRARALREEARRLEPWRRKIIRDVLPDRGRPTPEELYLATAIRDEEDEARAPAPTSPRVAALVLGGALVLGAAAVGIAVRAGASAAVLAGAAAGCAAGAAAALAILAWARRSPR